MAFRLFTGSERLLNQILSDLNTAGQQIHIQMYIIANDVVGNEIKSALIRAAKRQVAVYVIADAYGSHELPKTFIDELKKNNIRFRFFNKIIPFKNWQFGRRLHHKIITIDHNIAYVGGINLADKYFLHTPWLDFMIRTENTDIVAALSRFCSSIFHKKHFKRIRNFPPEILINDFVRNKIEISRTYKKLISEAQQNITIIAAYFLPSTSFRRKLKKASKKGLHITFLTGETSDVIWVKYAMEHLYYWLLKNNITLYEFQPSVVHAKLLTTDNRLITVGSYNLNKLSDVGSLELNLLLHHQEVLMQFQQIFDHSILPHCKPIDVTYTRQLPKWKKLRNFLSYYLVRFGLQMLTFFNRKERLHI